MGRKLTCMVVDDEAHAIELLQLHIAKVKLLELVFSTTNPIEAFEFVQEQMPDLIFLDIQMPALNGMDFLKLLRGKTKVILTTAYKEHALESYEYGVMDYLLKPIVFERFLKSIQKITGGQIESVSSPILPPSEKPKDHFFIKTGIRNKLIKIRFDEILYIESQGNYAIFYTKNGQYKTLLSLKELVSELPAEHFLRVHHSFVVANIFITGIEGNQLFVGEKIIPIGEAYRKLVLQEIDKNTLKK